MSLDMKQKLISKTITQLQRLIQANIDSRDAFLLATEEIDDAALQRTFTQFATDRQSQADDLARFVFWSGETPRIDGSLSAFVHRIWTRIQERVASDARQSIFNELRRGEDSIRTAYGRALASTVEGDLNDVLQRHYVVMESVDEHIQGLCDKIRV